LLPNNSSSLLGIRNLNVVVDGCREAGQAGSPAIPNTLCICTPGPVLFAAA
jgi:hypothetical protein